MAKETYVDFFLLENVTDQLLLHELDSDRGKHPKWISLISDENVQGAVKSCIRDTGYVKESRNLTLMDIVSWVKTNYNVGSEQVFCRSLAASTGLYICPAHQGCLLLTVTRGQMLWQACRPTSKL